MFSCLPLSLPFLELGDWHNILRMIKAQTIPTSAFRQRFLDVQKLKITLETLRNQKETGIHTLYCRRTESEESFKLRTLRIERTQINQQFLDWTCAMNNWKNKTGFLFDIHANKLPWKSPIISRQNPFRAK